MLSRKSVFVLSLMAAASFNAAACFTVYDRSSNVVYQGQQSPVDLSLPLKDAVNSRFPGGHMVFEQGGRCEPIALAQQQASRRAASTQVAGAPDTSVMGAGPANGKMTRAATAPVPAGVNSPMLTNRSTAIAANLPYRELGGGIVVIPAQAAAGMRMSSMTVVPSQAVAAAPTRGAPVTAGRS